MKGFILAAGFGTRLKPLTDSRPKPLLPVAGVPAICYALTLFLEAGIDEIVVNLHYRHRDIIDFFTEHDNFGIDVHFSIEEEEILGTGGGIKRCEDILGDDFVLVNSDVICDVSLGRLVEEFGRGGGQSLLLLYPNGLLSKPGPVSVKGHYVADFNSIRKTGMPPTHEYTGIAILGQEIFPLLDEKPSSVVNTGYAALAKQGRLGYFEHRGLWADIGTRESYDRACRLMARSPEMEERIYRQTRFRFSV